MMVSVIFRPHGRKTRSKLRYFPSPSITQTLYPAGMSEMRREWANCYDWTISNYKRWLQL